MRERRKEEFRNKEAVDEDRDKEDLGKEIRQRQVDPSTHFTALPTLFVNTVCHLFIAFPDNITLS